MLASGGIVDVIGLNNSFSFPTTAGRHLVKGFRAQSGYDLVTGLGTVDSGQAGAGPDRRPRARPSRT